MHFVQLIFAAYLVLPTQAALQTYNEVPQLQRDSYMTSFIVCIASFTFSLYVPLSYFALLQAIPV